MQDVEFDEIKRYKILKKIVDFQPNPRNIPESHQQMFKSQKYKGQYVRSIYEDIYENASYRQKYNYKRELDPILAESYTKISRQKRNNFLQRDHQCQTGETITCSYDCSGTTYIGCTLDEPGYTPGNCDPNIGAPHTPDQ